MEARAKVQKRVTDTELVFPLVNLVCVRAIPACSCSFVLQVLVATHEQRQRCLAHKVAKREITTAMVRKTVQLKIGWMDSRTGKVKVEKKVKRVSVPGESSKDGKNQAVVASDQTDRVKKITLRKDTTNHDSTKVTAQRHWAPEVGTTNHSTTVGSARRHRARVQGLANNNSTNTISKRHCVLVMNM